MIQAIENAPAWMVLWIGGSVIVLIGLSTLGTQDRDASRWAIFLGLMMLLFTPIVRG